MLQKIGVTEAQLESFAKERRDWLTPQGRLKPSERKKRLELFNSNTPERVKSMYLDRGSHAETMVEAFAHLSLSEFLNQIVTGKILEGQP
jgi:hypothetical protein